MCRNKPNQGGENFKSLKKEMEEDTRKCKELSRSQVGRLNAVKMVTDQVQHQFSGSAQTDSNST